MNRRTHLRGITDEMLTAARGLRRTATVAEAKLWDALRGGRLAGLRFRRQHPIDRFVLDFYCPSCHLVIELDGKVHDEPNQVALDQARTVALAQRGYHVIRFRNEEVLYQLTEVLEKIRHKASELSPPLPPAGEGDGG